MSIAELKKLVAPPARPFETGSPLRWTRIEKQLEVKLPRDYRAFVFAYGTGLFAGLYRVYNPFAKDEYMALLPQGKRVCDGNRVSQLSDPARFPYPYFPEPGGLLPWGNDENGNDYFWLTEGPPTKWPVVQDENRGRGIRVHRCSMTGFLTSILQRKIKPLSTGYPTKDDFKFEPWKPAT